MAIGEIVEPREIVKANNELFRCRYKIKDMIANRIFMAFASLVDHKNIKENQSFVEYQISASSIISNDVDSGEKYRVIREAAYILLDQKIEQKIGTTGFRAYTLFSTIEYNNGIIKGEFHKDLVPFFIIAKERFTKLKLDEYIQLPSIYSQAIFGFLKSWSDRSEITVKLSELHEMLDTPQSFRKDFYEFKRRVLDKAHKDINEKTSLHFEYEAIKTGRSVKEVKFRFVKKPALPANGNVPMPNAPREKNAHDFYEEFLKKFPDPTRNRIKAWSAWHGLFEKKIAPMAEDVPEDNALGIMEFLKSWQESHTK